MGDNSTSIRRSELYKEVWTTPIHQLAKKYGVSDVGLAKICKRYNIPRPPRGYWARKEAGQRVERLSLPRGEDRMITITPNPISQKANRTRELVAKISDSNQNGEEPIVVPGRLTNPHLLVQKTAEILHGRKADNDGLVFPLKRGCLDVAVSQDSLRRALRIMDTIIKVLEKRGYGVYLSEGDTRTKIQEVEISFGISEKLVTQKKRPEEHDLSGRYEFGHSRFIENRVPSGDLSLTIKKAKGFYVHGCRQNWNDGKKTKIEDRIGSFIDGLLVVAAAKIEHDREEEERERRRIERQRQLEEERGRRADLRRRYLAEETRVNRLISDAENWKRSQVLREYIAEVEKREAAGSLPSETEQPFTEWLKWARDQAERLDPLAPSPPSVLDEECPPEEKQNEYRYRW